MDETKVMDLLEALDVAALDATYNSMKRATEAYKAKEPHTHLTREERYAAGMALLRPFLAKAWDEGYVAGNAFGYEWAQDTYDGPAEDPTPNPYETEA